MTDAVTLGIIAAVPTTIGSIAVVLALFIKKSVDGTFTILTQQLKEETARANYSQGMLDKWMAIERRNDLLNATPQTPVPNHPFPDPNSQGDLR